MIVSLHHNKQQFNADLNQGMDISQVLSNRRKQANCFGAQSVEFNPMRGEGWEAKVKSGGSVNAQVVKFNPHGNGTHTECFGHISISHESVHEWHNTTHVISRLITVEPENIKGEAVISMNSMNKFLAHINAEEALVIRTLPNEQEDKIRDFTETNPPYLSVEVIKKLVEKNIKHLLIDLPSIDPEKDEGKVEGHKVFWNWPGYEGRKHCTITEMIYVPEEIEDGLYLLNMQRASFDLDCAPSRPILYKLEPF